MSKVVLKGYIVVPKQDLAKVTKELENHKALTIRESGCLVFEVTQSGQNPCIFNVYEEFKDKASFELHQKRVSSSYWGEVTVNVERHYQITE